MKNLNSKPGDVWDEEKGWVSPHDRSNVVVMFRPELVKLMVFCEQKLRENEHKGHWIGEPMSYLTKRLHDEFGELKRAIDKKASQETIFRECADIVNFAMMIADSYDPDET